jgi:hypothetical protein
LIELHNHNYKDRNQDQRHHYEKSASYACALPIFVDPETFVANMYVVNFTFARWMSIFDSALWGVFGAEAFLAANEATA